MELTPWTPGHTGNAIVFGSKDNPGVASWATVDGSPHHWEVASKEGIGNFIACEIAPDGGVHVLYGDPTCADDVVARTPGTHKAEGGLNFEQFGGVNPLLGPRAASEASLSRSKGLGGAKTANPLAEHLWGLRTAENGPRIVGRWDAPSPQAIAANPYNGRTPFIYHEPEHAVYIGNAGEHHVDVRAAHPSLLDECGSAMSWEGGSPGQHEGIITHGLANADERQRWPDGVEFITHQGHPEVLDAVSSFTGLPVADQGFDFTSATIEGQRPWEMGNWGKLMITPENEVHHWSLPHDEWGRDEVSRDSRPHHGEYVEMLGRAKDYYHQTGIEDEGGTPQRRWSPGWIDPHGRVEIMRGSQDRLPLVFEQMPGTSEDNGLDFEKFASLPVHDLSGQEAWGPDRRKRNNVHAFIGDLDHGLFLGGPSYHGPIYDEMQARGMPWGRHVRGLIHPDGTYEYLSPSPQHDFTPISETLQGMGYKPNDGLHNFDKWASTRVHWIGEPGLGRDHSMWVHPVHGLYIGDREQHHQDIVNQLPVEGPDKWKSAEAAGWHPAWIMPGDDHVEAYHKDVADMAGAHLGMPGRQYNDGSMDFEKFAGFLSPDPIQPPTPMKFPGKVKWVNGGEPHLDLQGGQSFWYHPEHGVVTGYGRMHHIDLVPYLGLSLGDDYYQDRMGAATGAGWHQAWLGGTRDPNTGEWHSPTVDHHDPAIRDAIARHLGLPSTDEEDQGFDFEKFAAWDGYGEEPPWTVTQSDFNPDDSFYTDFGPSRDNERVVVVHAPTREIVVGQPGTHHGDLIGHHGLDNETISLMPQHERQYHERQEDEPFNWSSDVGSAYAPQGLFYGSISNGGYSRIGQHPKGVTEALHAHGLLQHPDGSISHPAYDFEHFGHKVSEWDFESEPEEDQGIRWVYDYNNPTRVYFGDANKDMHSSIETRHMIEGDIYGVITPKGEIEAYNPPDDYDGTMNYIIGLIQHTYPKTHFIDGYAHGYKIASDSSRLKRLINESADYGEIYVNEDEHKVLINMGDADPGWLIDEIKTEAAKVYPQYRIEIGDEAAAPRRPGWKRSAWDFEGLNEKDDGYKWVWAGGKVSLAPAHTTHGEIQIGEHSGQGYGVVDPDGGVEFYTTEDPATMSAILKQIRYAVPNAHYVPGYNYGEHVASDQSRSYRDKDEHSRTHTYTDEQWEFIKRVVSERKSLPYQALPLEPDTHAHTTSHLPPQPATPNEPKTLMRSDLPIPSPVPHQGLLLRRSPQQELASFLSACKQGTEAKGYQSRAIPLPEGSKGLEGLYAPGVMRGPSLIDQPALSGVCPACGWLGSAVYGVCPHCGHEYSDGSTAWHSSTAHTAYNRPSCKEFLTSKSIREQVEILDGKFANESLSISTAGNEGAHHEDLVYNHVQRGFERGMPGKALVYPGRVVAWNTWANEAPHHQEVHGALCRNENILTTPMHYVDHISPQGEIEADPGFGRFHPLLQEAGFKLVQPGFDFEDHGPVSSAKRNPSENLDEIFVGKVYHNSAGRDPWQEGDPIEPWEPGRRGKGILYDGQPHLWATSDVYNGPHHSDVAYAIDPTESKPIDGYFHVNRDGTVQAEGHGDVHHFCESDPRLKPYDDGRYDFSGYESKTADTQNQQRGIDTAHDDIMDLLFGAPQEPKPLSEWEKRQIQWKAKRDAERAEWERDPMGAEKKQWDGLHQVSHPSVQWVPTHVMRQFIEYDRRPGGEHSRGNTERWEELANHIKQNGFKNEAVLEYNPDTGTAHLGEGNHRTWIALEHGIPAMPVRVNRSRRTSPTQVPVTLNPQPEWNDYRGEMRVPDSLKPEHIGLPTVPPPGEHLGAAEDVTEPERSPALPSLRPEPTVIEHGPDAISGFEGNMFGYEGRRPILYHPNSNTLHIGLDEEPHSTLRRRVDAKNGNNDLRDSYDHEGWLGHNPEGSGEGGELSDDDEIVNRGSANEYGWYFGHPGPHVDAALQKHFDAQPSDDKFDFEHFDKMAGIVEPQPIKIHDLKGLEPRHPTPWANRRPMLYNPLTGDLGIGNYDTTHRDLMNLAEEQAIPLRNSERHYGDILHGWLGPNPESWNAEGGEDAQVYNEDEPNEYGWYSPVPWNHVDHVNKALSDHFKAHPAPTDFDFEHFGRTGAYWETHDTLPKWEPGMDGKGLVLEDGSVHTWGIDPETHGPHHGEARQVINPNEQTRFYLHIYPDGRVQAEGGADLSQYKINDPRLKPDNNRTLDFERFGKTAGRIASVPPDFIHTQMHPSDSEYSYWDWHNEHALLYDPTTHRVYVGKPGIHHDDLIREFGLGHYDKNMAYGDVVPSGVFQNHGRFEQYPEVVNHIQDHFNAHKRSDDDIGGWDFEKFSKTATTINGDQPFGPVLYYPHSDNFYCHAPVTHSDYRSHGLLQDADLSQPGIRGWISPDGLEWLGMREPEEHITQGIANQLGIKVKASHWDFEKQGAVVSAPPEIEQPHPMVYWPHTGEIRIGQPYQHHEDVEMEGPQSNRLEQQGHRAIVRPGAIDWLYHEPPQDHDNVDAELTYHYGQPFETTNGFNFEHFASEGNEDHHHVKNAGKKEDAERQPPLVNEDKQRTKASRAKVDDEDKINRVESHARRLADIDWDRNSRPYIPELDDNPTASAQVHQPNGWTDPQTQRDQRQMRSPFWVQADPERENHYHVRLGLPGMEHGEIYHVHGPEYNDWQNRASGGIMPAGSGKIGPWGPSHYPNDTIEFYRDYMPHPIKNEWDAEQQYHDESEAAEQPSAFTGDELQSIVDTHDLGRQSVRESDAMHRAVEEALRDHFKGHYNFNPAVDNTGFDFEKFAADEAKDDEGIDYTDPLSGVDDSAWNIVPKSLNDLEPWKPGSEGKGIICSNGEIVTWTDMAMHHNEVYALLSEAGKRPKTLLDYIHPDGTVLVESKDPRDDELLIKAHMRPTHIQDEGAWDFNGMGMEDPEYVGLND